MISVAGCVGTRLFGYGNALVSEVETSQRRRRTGLAEGRVVCVWEADYSLAEVEEAEMDVQATLEIDRAVVSRLSDALLANRVLEKDEVLAICPRLAEFAKTAKHFGKRGDGKSRPNVCRPKATPFHKVCLWVQPSIAPNERCLRFE